MATKEKFIDFLYVGAPRAGSTWLAAALAEHPDVWIPHNKEIHFFNDRLLYSFEYKYPKGIEYYKKYFAAAPSGKIVGELSPFYYYDPNAAFRISKHCPDVKIIIFLRNPVNMIYSLYLLLRDREKRESSFERELIKNPQFLDLGYYHRHITPYFDQFPKENIYVGLYENFFEDEPQSIKDIFDFLGADRNFKPSNLGVRINSATSAPPGLKANVRGKIITALNYKYLTGIRDFLNSIRINKVDYSGIDKNIKKYDPRKEISQDLREELMKQFLPDINRLEALVGIDLSVWKNY